jgi:hypothetical protein
VSLEPSSGSPLRSPRQVVDIRRGFVLVLAHRAASPTKYGPSRPASDVFVSGSQPHSEARAARVAESVRDGGRWAPDEVGVLLPTMTLLPKEGLWSLPKLEAGHCVLK